MELNLATLIPDEIAKALCNTLIHSLWQGLILALITGITVVFTRKSSAALRYNLFIGYLFLFSAAITFTFFTQLRFNSSNAAQIVQLMEGEPSHAVMKTAQAVAGQQNFIASGINYLNAHSYAVVFVWFLIICARCVQLAIGLNDIYHLRRTKVFSAGTHWDNLIADLSRKIGIGRHVQIMQSGIARVPMMVGYFKPLILVPLGMLAALSAQEVETILLHELAHIKRKDYLVNLFQSLIGIIFFFNPAVLWLSALIKTERENCCDDMVLRYTDGDKARYIKALVSCYEYRQPAPSYAMSLKGSNDNLLHRVTRIVHNRNQSLNKVEKLVLSVSLVLTVLLIAGFSKSTTQKSSFAAKQPNNRLSNKGLSKPVFVATSTEPEITKTTPLIRLRKRPAGKISVENFGLAHADDTAKTLADTISNAKQDIADAIPKPAYRSDPPAPVKYKLLYSKIADELLEENLIKDKNKFGYVMTAHKLLIDGVEQPGEVHRRLFEKFIKEPDDNLNLVYNYSFHY